MRLTKRKSPCTPPYPLRGLRKPDDEATDRNRPSPLPPVSFADCTELWSLMCEMDEKYERTDDIFKNHPVLTSQMRAILLDWIMDVCEAYNLHRETLHLAIDYLDRYLASQKNILKHHLQLIGITCLFVASKIEEIYPPKLSVFSYVTDGACSESQILDMELVVMKMLKWRLTPITSATWLNIYLQLIGLLPYSTRSIDFYRFLKRDRKVDDCRLMTPQYAGVDYVRAIRILDLANMDINSLKFTYALLASAALYHTKGRATALAISGFSWEKLEPCVHWMAPFAQVVKKFEIPDVLPGIASVPDGARHLIQSHCVSLQMLEQARNANNNNKLCSPIGIAEGLLTPPRSTEKYYGKL